MAVFRNASGLVIRCFKKVEHFADWVTGAAGPYFIAFCWLLIGSGGLFFFDVIARDLSFFSFILLSPILVLIPLNLYCHYYLVTHVPPGYPSPRAVALNPRGSVPTDSETKWYNLDQRSIWTPERWGFHRKAGKTRSLTGDDGVSYSNAGGAQGRRVRRCRKCDGPKPERTHHCSVCKRCVLMMDHHCPWINACVGLHNQRHFILFMVWLSFACWTLAALGYQRFWDTFSYRAEWPAYTPKVGFTLIYVLCLAIGVAVPILCLWHIFMVTRNETSIESHDNSWLEGRAKAEGLIYLNPYDLGRRRNLQLFFNLGPQGYSPWTLLFPLVVPPSSNGWAYPRRQLPEDAHTAPARSSKPGGAEALSLTGSLHSPELMEGLLSPQGQGMAENGHGSGSRYVMGDDGGLTDDEEGGGGFMDY